jgi:uncharacterized protein (TIGR03067 family)
LYLLAGCLLVAVAAISPAFAAEPPRDAAPDDRSLLAGTWKVVEAERDGQGVAGLVGMTLTLTKDGGMQVQATGRRAAGGTFQISIAAKPHTFDYTLDYGPTRGKLLRGIYAIEGDLLKICRSDPGGDRPGDFSTKADSTRLLLVLRRIKP